ncbi:MAG: hypothetical protein ACJ8F7_18970 [Gemmataceae bacterium]
MFRTLSCAALLALSSPLLASTTLAPDDQKTATQLVGLLGHPSYKVREEASAKLVQYGRAVEPVLRQGLNSTDAETRARCKRLLPLALQYSVEKQIAAFLANRDEHDGSTLAGWAKFQQLAGCDDTARQLFADMHRMDPLFLEEMDREPAGARQKFATRCLEFMQMRNGGFGTAPPEQVALLLFAALQPQVAQNTAGVSYLSGGLNSLSYQAAGKELLRGHSILRKMLVQFLMHTDSSSAYTNLYLISNLELKEGVDIARNIIRLPNRDLHAKVMAISLLGKIGGKECVADIEPFLKDSTTFGAVRFGNGPQISTQVRDVALATLVQLTGQSMGDYHFPHVKMFPSQANFQVHLSPGMLGFTDDAGRTAALKKWADWRATEKK